MFTLADGRVALIHRIHPDMQLAVFDDLDHLWHAAEDYWDAHLADLERHTLLRPSPGALGSGRGRRRCAPQRGSCCSSTSGGPTAPTP